MDLLLTAIAVFEMNAKTTSLDIIKLFIMFFFGSVCGAQKVDVIAEFYLPQQEQPVPTTIHFIAR